MSIRRREGLLALHAEKSSQVAARTAGTPSLLMLHSTMSLIEDGTISLPYEGGSASSPTVLRNRRTLLRGRRDAVPPDVASHDVPD